MIPNSIEIYQKIMIEMNCIISGLSYLSFCESTHDTNAELLIIHGWMPMMAPLLNIGDQHVIHMFVDHINFASFP